MTLHRLRYALIRWLADGDMVLMNAEFNAWGNWRPRHAGRVVVMHCDLRVYRDTRSGVHFGSESNNASAALPLDRSPRGSYLGYCHFEGR